MDNKIVKLNIEIKAKRGNSDIEISQMEMLFQDSKYSYCFDSDKLIENFLADYKMVKDNWQMITFSLYVQSENRTYHENIAGIRYIKDYDETRRSSYDRNTQCYNKWIENWNFTLKDGKDIIKDIVRQGNCFYMDLLREN